MQGPRGAIIGGALLALGLGAGLLLGSLGDGSSGSAPTTAMPGNPLGAGPIGGDDATLDSWLGAGAAAAAAAVLRGDAGT